MVVVEARENLVTGAAVVEDLVVVVVGATSMSMDVGATGVVEGLVEEVGVVGMIEAVLVIVSKTLMVEVIMKVEEGGGDMETGSEIGVTVVVLRKPKPGNTTGVGAPAAAAAAALAGVEAEVGVGLLEAVVGVGALVPTGAMIGTTSLDRQPRLVAVGYQDSMFPCHRLLAGLDLMLPPTLSPQLVTYLLNQSLDLILLLQVSTSQRCPPDMAMELSQELRLVICRQGLVINLEAGLQPVSMIFKFSIYIYI